MVDVKRGAQESQLVKTLSWKKNLVEKIQKKYDVLRDNLKYLETAGIIIYNSQTFKMTGWTFKLSPKHRSCFFYKDCTDSFCCAFFGH